ncbi:hypothetical protein VTJ49DRAFT_2738 [Mycothermus thermophilus]|uniref:Sensitive to high expression protein 9, mitochondrial n=1 Tax=Humicola insolens TaxID=85995 RepID=A0ABR3VN55_HUMIN
MSANAALRRAVRPLRAPPILEELNAVPKFWSPGRPFSICRRCLVDANLGPGPRLRLFSTAPPPPRRPPPPLHRILEAEKSRLESASVASGNDLSKTLPTLQLNTSDQPPRPDPNPSSGTSSNATATSSSSSSSESKPTDSTSTTTTTKTTTDTPNNNTDPTLPSFTETHRHPLSARFSILMDNWQARVLVATQKLNDLTGYSAIEAIKARNLELEREHAAAQARLRTARHEYKSLTAHRASTQREVTTLLTRKDMWNPSDLERFTALYRLDHELESRVQAAAEELTDAESNEARLAAELNTGILRRYHEEQIWSDRIRRQSTWGTWGLMGMNVVLFLVLQFVAEPWKRKRLMRGIAESEKGVMDEVRRELAEVKAALEATGLREREQEVVAADAAADAGTQQLLPEDGESTGYVDAPTTLGEADVVPPPPMHIDRPPPRPWKEVLLDFWEDPELLREAILDLYSDRRIDLSMRDASLIALQGAAAGATVVAVLTLALLRASYA